MRMPFTRCRQWAAIETSQLIANYYTDAMIRVGAAQKIGVTPDCVACDAHRLGVRACFDLRQAPICWQSAQRWHMARRRLESLARGIGARWKVAADRGPKCG